MSAFADTQHRRDLRDTRIFESAGLIAQHMVRLDHLRARGLVRLRHAARIRGIDAVNVFVIDFVTACVGRAIDFHMTLGTLAQLSDFRIISTVDFEHQRTGLRNTGFLLALPRRYAGRCRHVSIAGAVNENLAFNTAISQMMIFVNAVYKADSCPKEFAEGFIKVLSPIAPHICEEIWEMFGHSETIAFESWPTYDESKCVDDEVEIAVQINGKVREKLVISATAEADEAIAAVFKHMQEYCEEQVEKLERIRKTQATYLSEKQSMEAKIREIREKVMAAAKEYDPQEEFGITQEYYEELMDKVNELYWDRMKEVLPHIPRLEKGEYFLQFEMPKERTKVMLKIENLTKHYKGSNKGVTNLSLHVEAGDIFAFIGHNGAGKTTTMKMRTRKE